MRIKGAPRRCARWTAGKQFRWLTAAKADADCPTVAEPAIRWLVDTVSRGNWKDYIPQLAAYPRDHFDYDADDRGLQLPDARNLNFA